eukprot:comp23219_c0_seq1/m.37828 comp23219_c0_seq1/g.37828  ORF comp23219_c0_seq1/g.37828 comp23219_c0_seq1/m.37828 type:complete len:293 (-) comp23219_c0_seq1:89-967(-)
MPRADLKERSLELEYDTFGDRATGKPLLLIMGLGTQMVAWHEEFCNQLVDRGFFVIRFDNRDVGLSSKFDHLGRPAVLYTVARRALGFSATSPYTLEDMADDTFALLDHLHLDKVHVCGASMGGMIAQIMAITRPERIFSLTSIMSTTGDSRLPWGHISVLMRLIKPRPTVFEERVEAGVDVYNAIGSPEYIDQDRLRSYVVAACKRSLYTDQGRQFSAILCAPDRIESLKQLKVPTLVLHGRIDPLLPLAHGQATARAIPGSKLVVFDHMGHDLPEPLYPQFVDEIASIAA